MYARSPSLFIRQYTHPKQSIGQSSFIPAVRATLSSKVNSSSSVSTSRVVISFDTSPIFEALRKAKEMFSGLKFANGSFDFPSCGNRALLRKKQSKCMTKRSKDRQLDGELSAPDIPLYGGSASSWRLLDLVRNISKQFSAWSTFLRPGGTLQLSNSFSNPWREI